MHMSPTPPLRAEYFLLRAHTCTHILMSTDTGHTAFVPWEKNTSKVVHKSQMDREAEEFLLRKGPMRNHAVLAKCVNL